MKSLVLLAAVAMSASASAQGPNMANKAAEAVGGVIGSGVHGAFDVVRDGQPRWVTVPGRPLKECMAESGGVINKGVMRCRDGWQEYVRIDTRGQRQVLSERQIPQ